MPTLFLVLRPRLSSSLVQFRTPADVAGAFRKLCARVSAWCAFSIFSKPFSNESRGSLFSSHAMFLWRSSFRTVSRVFGVRLPTLVYTHRRPHTQTTSPCGPAPVRLSLGMHPSDSGQLPERDRRPCARSVRWAARSKAPNSAIAPRKRAMKPLRSVGYPALLLLCALHVCIRASPVPGMCLVVRGPELVRRVEIDCRSTGTRCETRSPACRVYAISISFCSARERY
ncbi:hypothetical protein EXIGLDRAFT_348623 [Exidia glandulosa HHB12029]|uniref:Uncharacterized protein n=1 Tax=Exidia glandulosa HHB12029 TaxID=1314781 RepID=A0A165LER1_EXIGL|nr:hypothetical protein EXIGLDRAFT_348623 [Exidia glandulosa HHB12029]